MTGVRDDQVAALVRPRQVNQFVITGTFVIAPSQRLTTQIIVDSTVGFARGNLIQIMLDSGVNFQTRIAGIAGDVMMLVNALPASVGLLYGDPIENSVLRLDTTVSAGLFVLDSADGILNVNVLG